MHVRARDIGLAQLVSSKCAWAAGPYTSYEDFEIDVRLVLANCR